MSWDKRLADPNATVREPRRAFDVAAGLSRLAQDAGYGCAPPVRPTREVVPARDRLEVLSRWTLTQAGAAAHVKDLTTCIGDNGFGNLTFEFTRWIDLDIGRSRPSVRGPSRAGTGRGGGRRPRPPATAGARRPPS